MVPTEETAGASCAEEKVWNIGRCEALRKLSGQGWAASGPPSARVHGWWLSTEAHGQAETERQEDQLVNFSAGGRVTCYVHNLNQVGSSRSQCSTAFQRNSGHTAKEAVKSNFNTLINFQRTKKGFHS